MALGKSHFNDLLIANLETVPGESCLTDPLIAELEIVLRIVALQISCVRLND